MSRYGREEKAEIIILEQIIGKRPRRPQTYDMRKLRGKPEDIAFCEDYDKRILEWETKADIERAKRDIEVESAKNFIVPEAPSINANYQQIIGDFLYHYKRLKGKEFNLSNPYSNTEEPHQYIATLIFYFLKDERFFKSPLLRRELSVPSFNKGTITVGLAGCGKSTTWEALLACFKVHVDFCKEQLPSNLKEIKSKYDINSCKTTETVLEYDRNYNKDDVLNPLMTTKQLYIDDIIREPNCKYDFNLFKEVLLKRADRNRITHMTMNYVREFEETLLDGETILEPKTDINKALHQFETRYDFRVWDRIFGHYNIIQLTGKTFRR